MAFSNRADVKAAVKLWLARDDLDDERLNDFVSLAERDLTRQIRPFRREDTTDLTIDAEEVNVPSRFRGVVELYLDTDPRTFLTFMPIEEFRIYQAGTSSGKPLRYTLRGGVTSLGSFIFAPIPDDEYTGKLTYNKAIETSDDEDAVSTLFAGSYLHASLKHAWLYLQNPQMAANHERLFMQEVEEINRERERDKYSGSALRPRAMYQETPYR